MDIETFRDYCMEKPGVTEELPFGPDTLVFKVGGKIFALTDINTFASINLKCEPERAVELRDQYDFIRPGYHMNKKHWNTVLLESGLNDALLRDLIDHSYARVYAALPKVVKLRIFAENYNASS